MKTLLFKPFDKYSGFPILITGILATALGTFLSFYFSIRFDGVLDVHISPGLSLSRATADNLIVMVSLFVLLYVAGLLVCPKTRMIDLLTTVLIARIPMYLVSLMNIGHWLDEVETSLRQQIETGDLNPLGIPNIGWLVAFGLVTFGFVVWYIALLYNGYKISTNAKGAKPIALFIGAIVLAEIISKILIVQINLS